jgi:hypothetical protein
MSYDFRLKFAGNKGQIQADPAHRAAVRRLTGNGRKSSDLLGITPTGESRIGGSRPRPSQDSPMPFSTRLPSPPIWRTDAQQRVVAVIEWSVASGQAADP